ncbi:MAG: phage major capsid protein [Caldisericales bacterium]|nr:phage major capsid protein [Caldisericales bacterium]
MDQFKDAIADTIRTLITSLNLDKVDLRHSVFPGMDNKEDLARTAGERTRKFMRGIVTGDINLLRELQTGVINDGEVRTSLTEGTPAQGGYLVPDEFMNTVVVLIPQYGVARRYCRVIPMTSDTKRIPKLSTVGITTYWPGEGAAITASQPVFGEIPLTAKKAGQIIPMTNELLEDTDLLVALLTDLAAQQFAYAEDNQLFNGNASSPAITGIFNAGSGATVVTMGTGKISGADIDYGDLVDLEEAVPGNYLAGARYFMHRNMFKYIRKIKDDAGGYVYVAKEKLINEYGYEKAEAAPSTVTTAATKVLCLANLSQSHVFGDRKRMTLALLKEGTVGSDNLGEKDMSAFRFIERVDIQESQPTACVVLKTAAA